MLLFRALARLVTFLLLLALAIAGLLLAIAALQRSFSFLGALGLPAVRDSVGSFLDQIESPVIPGRTAALTGLGGLLAVLVGILLLVGALGRRPAGVVVLEDDQDGRIAARKRPLTNVAETLARQTRDATDLTVKLKPRSNGQGGDLQINAAHPRSTPREEVEQQASQSVAGLAEAFGLRTRVRARQGESGERVS